MTFAEHIAEQRQRNEAKSDDLLKRHRLTFAEGYSRMEAASPVDPNEEDCTDLG